MKIETKFKKICEMPDSNLKLLKMLSLGLSIGMFNKEPIINEVNRLCEKGYKATTKE